LQDGYRHALVVGRGSAGQVWLLEDAQQGGTVQRIGGAIVVALPTGRLEDNMAVRLLRVELIERQGRRRGVAAEK
jgi:hypothetical protein